MSVGRFQLGTLRCQAVSICVIWPSAPEFTYAFAAWTRAMLRRCRPDWDIQSPEQRAAWAKGDKSGFHPYGKTLAQEIADQD